jgi:hypothetical protein
MLVAAAVAGITMLVARGAVVARGGMGLRMLLTMARRARQIEVKGAVVLLTHTMAKMVA